jgi:hypothetical protein
MTNRSTRTQTRVEDEDFVPVTAKRQANPYTGLVVLYWYLLVTAAVSVFIALAGVVALATGVGTQAIILIPSGLSGAVVAWGLADVCDIVKRWGMSI